MYAALRYLQLEVSTVEKAAGGAGLAGFREERVDFFPVAAHGVHNFGLLARVAELELVERDAAVSAAYVSVRQRTSAYISVRQHTKGDVLRSDVLLHVSHCSLFFVIAFTSICANL